MARALNTSTAARSYTEDPAPGTILEAAVGGQAEAEFNFNNDSPDVASFYLEVAGLPAHWLFGAGTQYESMAAAFGSSSLRLSLVPPPDAEPGDYDYQVSILCGGSPIAAPLALVLRVNPPTELFLPPVPMMEPATVEPATVEPAAVEPAPVEPAAPSLRVPRRTAKKTEVIKTEAVPAAETVPKTISERVPEQMPEEPAIVFAPAPTPPAVLDVTPPVVLDVTPPPAPKPVPRPVPSRPVPPPSRPVPTPVPAYAEADEQPVLVDMAAPRMPEPEDDDLDEPPQADAERAVRNPEEGQILTIRPGETLLVRFSFTNDAPRTRTYILDEDRSLGDQWLTLVQDQVNLTRNGTGDVSLRLSPPRDAAPGEYPFSVTVGPEGGPLAARLLIVSVLATPAVRLTVKAATVRVGPLASGIEFPLTIESAGNAETAFRLGVQAPQSESDTEDTVGRREYSYEAPNWRYLFDKELDTLRSPSTGRTPRPVPISLRLQRRGIWWLGWQESHTVQVAAVPVTDPSNGGKTENEVRLTATRWRVLPFPALLLIPIVSLLLILLSGGASNLEITNAQHFGDSYYVLQAENIKEEPGKPAVPMSAHLDWNAPWYALLSLKATTGNATDAKGFVHGSASDAYSVTEYGKDRTYTVSPLLVAGNATVTARFVPARTQNKLKLSTGSERTPVEVTSSDLQSGDTVISNGQASATVSVPRGGTLRLNLENTTPASQGLRIDVWLVQMPSAYSVNNVTTTNNNPITSGQTITAQIKARPGESQTDDQELTLVTTDAGHQVLHVHLKVRN